MFPKITDSLEKIAEINNDLYQKYNRHHVLNDKLFLLDPVIDPMSYFSNIRDIDGNLGTTFKVQLGFEKYVLQKLPHYVWDSDEKYLEGQFNKMCKIVEVSYDFEDLKIPNTCKIHHIFIKRSYNSRYQKFYFSVWILKEYFDGDSFLMFDYGAQYPREFCDTPFNGKHREGRLISLKAAKQFSKELVSVYIQLLSNCYFPHRYNDNGIIISYDNDKIEWRYVDYTHCTKKTPNSAEICFAIDEFKRMLCWLLCNYSNCTTDEKSSYSNPFFMGLEKLMEEKRKYFHDIGQKEYNRYMKESLKWDQNWPILEANSCKETFELFLDYINSSYESSPVLKRGKY